jgi:hypothetical protein
MAGGKGFEPLHTDPESAVLPLDEPPVFNRKILPRPFIDVQSDAWIVTSDQPALIFE